jgi:hypothetical protein
MDEIRRMDEIYEEGVARYLDKTDFDVSNWLTDEEKKEYKLLYLKMNGECPFCGETPDKNCEC